MTLAHAYKSVKIDFKIFQTRNMKWDSCFGNFQECYIAPAAHGICWLLTLSGEMHVKWNACKKPHVKNSKVVWFSFKYSEIDLSSALRSKLLLVFSITNKLTGTNVLKEYNKNDNL